MSNPDDAWDEIRDIIGPDLFDELTNGSRYTEAEYAYRNLSPETEAMIRATNYHLMAPVDGDLVLSSVGALMHYVDEGCPDCCEYLIGFAATLIGEIWSMVMETAGLGGGTNE